MGAQHFRKALRPISIACLIAAGGCGLVIGDLPEPSSGPLNPGAGGTVAGSSGSGGSDGGSTGSGDAAAGTAGRSGSSGEGGTLGDGGSAGKGGTSGVAGAGATSGAAGDGGTAGQAGANGSAGVGGTSGVSGTGGASGTGGTSGRGGASGTSGTSGVGGSAGSAGNCDRDGDQAAPPSCGGMDCDDNNPVVKPSQTGWFDVARPGGGGTFDYNCNSLEDREFPTPTVCNTVADITNCPNQPQGFLGAAPVCGGKGNWGNCKRGGLANLECLQNVITVDKVMRCH